MRPHIPLWLPVLVTKTLVNTMERRKDNNNTEIGPLLTLEGDPLTLKVDHTLKADQSIPRHLLCTKGHGAFCKRL